MAHHQNINNNIQPQSSIPFQYQRFESPHNKNLFYRTKESNNEIRQRRIDDQKNITRQRYQSVNDKSRFHNIRGHSLLGNNLNKSKELIETSLLQNQKQITFEQEKSQNIAQKKQQQHHHYRPSSYSIGIYRQKYGNKNLIVDEMTKIEEQNPNHVNNKKWVSSIKNQNQKSIAQTLQKGLQILKQVKWQAPIPKKFNLSSQFPIRMKERIIQHRNIVLGILVNYHKTMKLPIQALFIAVNIFDRYLQQKSQQNLTIHELSSIIDLNQTLKQWNKGIFQIRQMAIIGITCLYISNKIQKYKVYHINSWIKHLTAINIPLLSLALPQICQQLNQIETVQQNKSLLLKRILELEGKIFSQLNFNIWNCTHYQILMNIYMLLNNKMYIGSLNESNKKQQSPMRLPPQQQFYFSLYLLEMSIFCDFTQINQPNCQNILCIEIVLSIIFLSIYFFRSPIQNRPQERLRQIIKILMPQLQDSEMTQNVNQKVQKIKKLGNCIFKIIVQQKPVYFSGIIQKYSKFQNHCVAKFKFKQLQCRYSAQQLCRPTSIYEQNTISPKNINNHGLNQSIHNQTQFSNFSSSDTDLIMMKSDTDLMMMRSGS